MMLQNTLIKTKNNGKLRIIQMVYNTKFIMQALYAGLFTWGLTALGAVSLFI